VLGLLKTNLGRANGWSGEKIPAGSRWEPGRFDEPKPAMKPKPELAPL